MEIMFSALIHVLYRYVHLPCRDGVFPQVARIVPRTVMRSLGLVLGVLGLLATPAAFAQQYQPFGPVDTYPDLQLFAPVEMGHFGERPAAREGLFFTYDRLVWSIEGLRHSTGLNLPIFRAIDHFPGGPAAPPVVPNSLNGTVPDAKFTWGNRYEFGYVIDHSGWLVSYVEGFKQKQDAQFGFDAGTNPLGSVMVVFTSPPGLLDGFIDVIDNNTGTPQQGGVDRTDNVGDGFADDVDGDGIHGPDGLDANGDGVPETTLGIPTDFDDLVTFLPTFQTLSARNVVRMSSIELMKMYRFTPFHRGSVFEFFYGARYMFLRDTFDVSATGGTLGTSNWDTQVTNNIVGPQLGGRLFNQRGRWTLQAEARFLAGYNIRNLSQDGGIGGGTVAGAHNSPLFLNPTTFRSGRQDQQFSPVGELRVSTTFNLTKSMALKVGWTGTFIGNIARASSSVRYNLPNMGLLADDHQNIFANGVNFGFVINR